VRSGTQRTSIVTVVFYHWNVFFVAVVSFFVAVVSFVAVGENGNTVSTVEVDTNGNLRAKSDVTINSKIDGDSYAAAVGHEGSHAADAQRCRSQRLH